MSHSSLFFRYRCVFAVACFTLSLGFASRVTAQTPVYDITNLGNLGSENDSTKFINNNGQVVGHSRITQAVAHAFLWTPDAPNGTSGPRPVDLGTLGGQRSSALGINAYGQVVGGSDTNGSVHAFLWTSGGTDGVVGNPQMKDLGTLGGGTSKATDINAFGQVVGISTTPGGETHAFLWTPGGTDGVVGNPQMKDLGTLGGAHSRALGINTFGQVVGLSDTAHGPSHAFLWTPSVSNGTTGPPMVNLGTLGGATSRATAINDAGKIVGDSRPGNSRSHAFLWTPGGTDGVVGNPQMKDLGILKGATDSFAHDINNSDQVVGFVVETDGAHRAFVWQDGKMVDFNQLIPADANWTLNEAYCVNDVGQPVGAGSQGQFLLTPVGHLFPDHGGNTGDVSLTLLYPDLPKQAAISLGVHDSTGAEQTITTGVNTFIVDDSDFQLHVLRTTFHLNGVPTGIYDVVVGSGIILPYAFRVQQSGAPQIILRVVGRDKPRVSYPDHPYPETYQVIVTNQGSQDAICVPVWLGGLPPGTGLSANTQDPPPIFGVSVSDIPKFITNPANHNVTCPLIIPRVPAGAKVSLEFQLTFPSTLLNTAVGLTASTTPLYNQLFATNNKNLLGSFTQVISQTYQAAGGNLNDVNAPYYIGIAAQQMWNQLGRIAEIDYQSQGGADLPCSLAQLVAQAVRYTANNTKASLSDIGSANDQVLSNPGAFTCLKPQSLEAKSVTVAGSDDPNSVSGPVGWIAASRAFTLHISCSNAPKALSAQDVEIIAHLNPAVLDMNTLNLGNMLVVTDHLHPELQVVPVKNLQPFGPTFLSDLRVTVNADLNLNLDNATLIHPSSTNALTWDFNGPDAGFLKYPDDIQVTLSVLPRAGLMTGSLNDGNWVEISFDGVPGKPINLPANPIDYDIPTSSVLLPIGPTSLSNPDVLVPWTWSKQTVGSGMKDVTFYFSDNNNGFVPWNTITSLTNLKPVPFTGKLNHTYSFYSIARDKAGNVQPVPLPPYPTITIVMGPAQITLSPQSVLGGGSVSGTVTLDGPAPSEGIVVSLSTTNPAVILPRGDRVIIPAGKSSQAFPVATQPVTSDTVSTVTATAMGYSVSQVLTVRAPGLRMLKLKTTTVRGGKSVQSTVYLNGPAAADTAVMLATTNSAASVPASVTVKKGNTSAIFTVSTVSPGAGNAVGPVTATLGSNSSSVTLTVTP